MDFKFTFGLMLLITGVILVVAGLAFMFIDKIPLPGGLPGDINIHGKNWSFHFPVVTGIIISLILTLILNLIFRR